jgi:hypothetical protein
MDVQALGRMLIIVAIVILIVGVALLLVGRIPLIGRLPGDFTIRRDGFTLFFPLATMIIISIILTIVLSVIGRWWR